MTFDPNQNEALHKPRSRVTEMNYILTLVRTVLDGGLHLVCHPLELEKSFMRSRAVSFASTLPDALLGNRDRVQSVYGDVKVA